MTEHERQLVHAFNNHLGDDGIAYRFKQHRFTSQLCDVAVDTAPDYMADLAIEAKSTKADSVSDAKLYFSSSFSKKDNSHQVERISEFIDRSGRTGYLAVEIKRGRGKQRKCILVPWRYVREAYANDDKKPGITNNNYLEIPRDGSDYVIPDDFFEQT